MAVTVTVTAASSPLSGQSAQPADLTVTLPPLTAAHHSSLHSCSPLTRVSVCCGWLAVTVSCPLHSRLSSLLRPLSQLSARTRAAVPPVRHCPHALIPSVRLHWHHFSQPALVVSFSTARFLFRKITKFAPSLELGTIKINRPHH